MSSNTDVNENIIVPEPKKPLSTLSFTALGTAAAAAFGAVAYAIANKLGIKPLVGSKPLSMVDGAIDAAMVGGGMSLIFGQGQQREYELKKDRATLQQDNFEMKQKLSHVERLVASNNASEPEKDDCHCRG